jgi:hypothetical protein
MGGQALGCFLNVEALPNSIKRKHPRQGEKKKQGARTNMSASKRSKSGGPQIGGEAE